MSSGGDTNYECEPSVFRLAVELIVPSVLLDGTEREHGECGMEAKRK